MRTRCNGLPNWVAKRTELNASWIQISCWLHHRREATLWLCFKEQLPTDIFWIWIKMWRIRQGPQFKHGLETLVYLRDLGPVTNPALPWNSRGAYYYSWRDLGLGLSRRYLNWKLSFSLFSNFPSLHAYLFFLCLTLESVTLKQGVIFCLFSIFSTDDVFDCLQLNRKHTPMVHHEQLHCLHTQKHQFSS